MRTKLITELRSYMQSLQWSLQGALQWS